jgi:hypothetical protein
MHNDKHPPSRGGQVTIHPHGSVSAVLPGPDDETHDDNEGIDEEFKLPPKSSLAIIILSNVLLQVSGV